MTTKADVNEAKTPERRSRFRDICYGDLFVGSAGLGLGVAAVTIEIMRNYEFGASKGPVVACSYALFAIGLATVPAVAQKHGWTVFLRVLLVVCMSLTGYFGISYYAKGILDKANAARNATLQYQDARQEVSAAERDRATAQAEADAIGETAPSVSLQRLYDDAKARRDAEATDPKRGARCGENCRKAEKEATGLLDRLGQAQAKEAALARVTAAQTRLDRGKSDAKNGAIEGNAVATLVAMQTGANADAIAGGIDIGEPVIMVIGMLFFAAMIDSSLRVFISGLGIRREVSASGEEIGAATKGQRPPKPEKKLPRGRKPRTQEEWIMQFAGERLRPGAGEVTGGQVMESFSDWWRGTCPGQTLPSMNVVSAILTEKAGIKKAKRGGKVRYEAGFAD